MNNQLIVFQELKQTTKFAFGVCLLKFLLPQIKNILKTPSLILNMRPKQLDWGLFTFLMFSNVVYKVSCDTFENYVIFLFRFYSH